MKHLTTMLAAFVAVSITFFSCSSDGDDEPKETLYDVQYSELVYTLDSVKMFVEYAHPKDSCTFYYFGDYKKEIGRIKTAMPSYKEVYYSEDKQNTYPFTYTFSNSTANIHYDNGKSETIVMKKNCKGTPHYNDKVYFNGKPYSRVGE